MNESNGKTGKKVNGKHIIILIVSLLVTAASAWYKSASTNTANVVEGNIFVLETEKNGEWKDTGYLVFGGKDTGYGSLFISTNSKSYIDNLNSSGKLSDMLSYQSSQYARFWDIEADVKDLKWPQGLSEDFAPDSRTFHEVSLDVSKVSGVFTKKITGVFHYTTFDFPPENDNVALVKYSKIKN